MNDERHSYRVSDEAQQVAQEAQRLAHLTSQRDPHSFALLDEIGVAAGWSCLEVGAGSGSVTRWLSERVGSGGRVVAVDVDIRFHLPVGGNAEVRRLDVTRAELGEAEFDLVHARAVLQHLHQREAVLDKMVAAAKPGGWIVLQDADWTLYEQQTIPEPFRSFSLASLESARRRNGWDGHLGRWLLPALRARGLRDCDCRGSLWTMHGGTPSAEWYVAGLARNRDAFVQAGLMDAAEIDRALEQARSPEFAILSPTSIQAWGRRPG